ncbi:hypothetical protein, partial [Burkholderia sp. SIMBA_024]|uniref:hypothetical protein n=1 Tax=Burkholderia sp. SIMBA_024 TaxID=3085768 RepID=UPI00397B0B40
LTHLTSWSNTATEPVTPPLRNLMNAHRLPYRIKPISYILKNKSLFKNVKNKPFLFKKSIISYD